MSTTPKLELVLQQQVPERRAILLEVIEAESIPTDCMGIEGMCPGSAAVYVTAMELGFQRVPMCWSHALVECAKWGVGL